MGRLIFELINRMLLFVAALVFVSGSINSIFGTNLGVKIGAERIELPQEFIGVVAITIALLLLSAVLSFFLNIRLIINWFKASPGKASAITLGSLTAVIAGITFGVLQFVGGPLPIAVSNGNVDRVESILADGGIDQTMLDEQLYQAVANADYEIAELLLDYGADINHKFGEFETPLLHAAVLWYDVAAAEFLLQQGASPNDTDNLGRTALIQAVQYRSGYTEAEANEALEIVAALMQAGADPLIAADNGDTPQSIAEERNHDLIVARLLQ
ncbi:MAG: ankyrin repeat domain-containing protein [Chloroflexota bacterium]